jgi:hypothetical protein
MMTVLFDILELRCIVRVKILNKYHQPPSGGREVAQKGVKTLSSLESFSIVEYNTTEDNQHTTHHLYKCPFIEYQPGVLTSRVAVTVET